jgi:hypothetical protein
MLICCYFNQENRDHCVYIILFGLFKGASDFSKKYLNFLTNFPEGEVRHEIRECINFDNFCEIIHISDGFSRYLETYYGLIRW